MADLVGLALIAALIVSGFYLVHSMTITRSLVKVRVTAVVSIVLMLLLMYHFISGA